MRHAFLLLTMAFLYLIYSCSGDKKMEENVKTRGLVDTIGYRKIY